MAQQTVVEWLLYNLVYHNLVDNSPKSKLWELTKQAKEMEKQQIIEAAKWLPKPFDGMEFLPELAEQYYNETYDNK